MANRSNPYWLRGSDRRLGLTARPAFDDPEEEFAAIVAASDAAGDAIEYESDADARRRRKTDASAKRAAKKAARTAHLRGRPQSLRTAARRLGGISHASWTTTYPGDTAPETRKALPGVFRSRRGGGMPWELLAERLRGEGFGPQHAVGATEQRSENWLADALDSEAAGTPVYSHGSAEWLMRREESDQLRRHREQGAYERAERRAMRKANPLLAVVENPTLKPSRAAAQAFRTFHGVAPRSVRRIALPDARELIALGSLERVEYRPTLGDRRGPVYFHDLFPGATLAADPAGRVLVIVPGSRPFRIDWRRGIIG